jgi:hypothetical protein
MPDTVEYNHWGLEVSPCDDCPNIIRCSSGLACKSFSSFLHSDNRNEWKSLPKEPTEKIFRHLFG